MAEAGPRSCPFCGSDNTKAFEDGSGLCGNCGRAFRGAAGGPSVVGETVEPVRRGPVAREPIRIGLLGVAGGLLAWIAIPVGFLVIAALQRRPVDVVIAGVLNTAFGALVCLGIALLVVLGWIAMWSGWLVWRGFHERSLYLLVCGIALIATSALLTGGVLGIAGGALAAASGFVVRRRTSEPEPGTGPA